MYPFPPLNQNLLINRLVPVSFFIIAGALAFALSTRVRGIFWFVLQCILNPFEDPDPPDPPRTPAQGVLQTESHRSKVPWAWRKNRKSKGKDDVDENDFWIDHRAKQNYEYQIPVLNRW